MRRTTAGAREIPALRRRTLLGAASAAVVAGCADRAPDETPGARGTFVLVHGAWHGGWCWQRVTPLLELAGYRVIAPTLTGLGERAHLARPDIDLDLHVRDLEAVFEMDDLDDVVLVGHSYAGFVISRVAELLPHRLRKLVYLDAFVPEHGKCVLDYVEPAGQRRELFASGQAEGYVPPLPLAAFGVVKPGDVAWAQPRLVKQPFDTLHQPVRLARPAGAGLPRAYVSCTSPPSAAFEAFAARLRHDPGWEFHELWSGHNAMITDPAGLARRLAAIARRPAERGIAAHPAQG